MSEDPKKPDVVSNGTGTVTQYDWHSGSSSSSSAHVDVQQALAGMKTVRHQEVVIDPDGGAHTRTRRDPVDNGRRDDRRRRH